MVWGHALLMHTRILWNIVFFLDSWSCRDAFDTFRILMQAVGMHIKGLLEIAKSWGVISSGEFGTGQQKNN